jgi:hydroxypyruvate isomerase
MPRFAANLGHLFTERPLIERFGAAAAAGFTAVELQFPYDLPPAQVKAIFAAMDRLGYAGFVGCEYKPRTRTEDGLGWAKPYGVAPKGNRPHAS